MSSEDKLEAAHRRSIIHRAEIERSKKCGCFHCRKVFDCEQITEWVDVDGGTVEEQTALCPKCGIDAVIGDASGFPITVEFLRKMKRRFC